MALNYIDINEVENKTLAKLTAKEIGLFGLCNCGIGLYRGELKSRYNGMRRTSEDGVTFIFHGEKRNVEFTEIVSESDTREWAARVYNNTLKEYEHFPMGITGCGFFR